MKTLKFKNGKVDCEESFKIDRNLIAKFGTEIYKRGEVKAISIAVKFDDGSAISFKRNESDDEVERIISEDDDE